MIKSIKAVSILFLFISIYANGQQKAGVSIFFGPTYQIINNSDLGVNVGVEFFLDDFTAIAPSFSYYFSAKGITTYAFNADVRYYLNRNRRFNYYAIGGFNYLIVKNTLVSPEFKTSSFGVNAGGGFLIELNDKVGLLGQLKYDSSGASSIEPMIGVSYHF